MKSYTHTASDGQNASCPECGSSFTIDPTAEVEEVYHPGYHVVVGTELPTRLRRAIIAFCNGCEYVHEIQPNLAQQSLAQQSLAQQQEAA